MIFTFHYQQNQMDCGPTCLYMISRYYGRVIALEKLRELSEIGKEGVSLLGISDAAEKIGLQTTALKLSFTKLIEEAPKPAILHWGQNHFIILQPQKKYFFHNKLHKNITIADPAKGIITINKELFLQKWISDKNDQGEPTGIALLLEPGQDFYNNQYNDDFAEKKTNHINQLIGYIRPHKKLVFQLLLGVILGSLLQLVFPFLTQSVVDVGINTQNIQFVYIILFAQLALFIGRLSVEFIRSWILYHISSRINISILTGFLIKLMKLPLAYFDSKKTGDILQRMNDHQRIQNFLTGTSLNTLFSLFNLLVFSIVLLNYSGLIFGVFAAASAFYIVWILLFLKKRKQLDYQQFDIAAAEQSRTIQLVQGMQEIKLHGSEKQQRWQWEHLQAALFRIGMKGLSLNQWQQAGGFFINEGKNIFITFIAATAVIQGQITLGAMLAIQYMIGQLNAPIEQMIGFVQNWQLAKISLERLDEINQLPDEEPVILNGNKANQLVTQLPENRSLHLHNISFTYPGAGNEPVLKNITIQIPHGKVTAIVGTSGSGKTTLLKLLLKFYDTKSGEIYIGDTTESLGLNLSNISHRAWRKQCGVVMQDSFIFSDSIAKNIAVGEDYPDTEKLRHAAKIANITSFIESLPLGYNTKIGAEGTGVSAGQRQRILIARAVYKNPDIILLDEATNALDANNERTILKNLNQFFEGKTVVVVAHRLSTVKNADQIVVLHNGVIIEQGTHLELTALKGEYFLLVKNQLELGD
ncbi:MAG: peptidase domain-containing ABC transporter [Sphingobacteriia bacterium]|nr:MAG: peptidase domain-containing ABC transporter [Sphingobacteriia bacterium]TAG29153.1 MAG: peptidase domain-containing ABC transporter [Sphingobacteriia bacterium]